MKRNILFFVCVFLLTVGVNAQNIPDSIYTNCEVIPAFTGGDAACRSYLIKNIIIPDDASKQNVEGIAYVQFVVERNGSLSSVELKKGILKSVDDEIVRVVKEMPAWSPAISNRINVRYQYTLPVRIRQFDYLKFDSLVDFLDSNYYLVDQAMSSHYSVIKKGKSSFLVSYYRKNGTLVEEQMCRTIHPNVKHGENVIYFEDKKVKTKGIFVNDKKEGGFTTYNQDGVRIKEENFENGLSKEVKSVIPNEEEPIYSVCEAPPSFPGGEDAKKKFIKDNLVYPERAKKKGNEGVVYIEFVVERDGSISKPSIKRNIGYDCGEEALRLVKLMPKWEPGMIRGKPVRAQFALPIKFALD